jgi:chemotaxis protein MotB
MALGRSRRVLRSIDYWPGFVDALTTMLLVIIFLLSVFMLSQYFMSREVSTKESALSKLNRQIEELTSLLALERAGKSQAEANLASLSATLYTSDNEKTRLQGLLASTTSSSAAADSRVAAIGHDLEVQKDVASRALAQIDILNQQILALRKQLGALEDALNASESRDKDSQAQIADLGSRLNLALAQKVQELARYRSDFFGRLREILGNRPEIKVVGDRFVFQSEVLFDAGQAAINPDGQAELDKLATAVIELEREIPPEIPWIMRVDGHTDKRPITSAQFKSNWDLSASRAISVVQYLVSKGVDPTRLLAAGFGEFQPIDTGDSDEALRRNRRIELKITER